jgi:hypothetical protein
MLTQAQVQRHANESGLRDIMIAEKEVVLTYLPPTNQKLGRPCTSCRGSGSI